MTLIQTRALSLTLGRPLFADLDLTLAKGDRLGLVAANGRGKSSLLRCLAGGIEPTAGDITRARGLRPALVEQDLPDALAPLTLRQAALSLLDPEVAEYEGWRAEIALDDLAVPEALRDRPTGELSGGWQRVALLARAWVSEPDVLLLDEPTNHLDLSRIGVLERWLSTVARDVPLIVASHDRAFLDAVTTRTLFLRETGSRTFPLPYSRARVALDEADAAAGRAFDAEMARAAQLRRQAAKLHNIGVNSGSDLLVVKTKQLRDRAAKIEEQARPAHHERSAGAIRLAHGDSHAKALVALDDVAVTAPDGRPLFRTGRLWIERGDRVVVLGANGAGKSQLFGMIVRALTAPVEGLRIAPSVIAGVADQGLTDLGACRTPWDAVAGRFDIGDARSRAVLAQAGIGTDLQQRPMTALSGGQRARLAMLCLRLSAPNLHLLDEPTNHLDIEGQEALEGELTDPAATCLLISHDRSFVRAVGTRFWEIRGKRLVEVEGPEGFLAGQMAG